MSDATIADAASDAGAQPSAPAPSAPRSSRPRLRLALVSVVILAAVGFLLVKGLGSSLDYFKTVSQAVDQRPELGTSSFRLEGVVGPEVSRSEDGASFDVTEGSTSIHVVNVGSPPELFKPTMPVIVVGHFASPSSMTFLSNEIMVKHTADYIAAHPDRVRDGNGKTN
jgi:cytochrome c-type biogenesis protein CcmE